MKKIKRFMVFEYEKYYPEGGMGDYKHSFDMVEEAKEYVKKRRDYDRYHDIFDRIEGVKIGSYKLEGEISESPEEGYE